MRRVLAPVLLAASALAAAPAAPQIGPELRALLSGPLGFSPVALADVVRGKAVTVSLEGGDPREVAVVGAVLVRVPKDTLVDRVRDIARFKRSPDVLQIGRFSNPPVASDLDALTVTKDDADFRTCRVGACGVRLSREAIARFQHDIDWTAPDADSRAAALFKDVLLGTVQGYLSGDGTRMTRYEDGDAPILPVNDFAGLLAHSSFLADLVPGLPAHLEHFPERALEGAEDFLYWSKEKFGLAPFITVTHVTICRSPAGTVVITSKDVYSSRYIDASLGVTVAADAVNAPDAFHLVYANRSRAQALDGGLGPLRRSIARRRARGGLEDTLRLTKARLERPAG